MKKNILSIIAAICVLAIIWGCTKSNGNNETTLTNTSTNLSTNSQSEKGETSSTNVADTTVKADNMGVDGYSTEKVIWGPGRAENHQQPTDPVMLNGQYKNLGGTFLLDDKKSICLTFDEGYENGFTPFSTGTPVFSQFLHNLPQNKNPAEAGVNRNEDSCVKRLPPHPALRGHLQSTR